MTPLSNQENRVPGIVDAIVFRAKAVALQVKRAALGTISNPVERFPVRNYLTGKKIIAESRTMLWTDHENSEKILVAGKIHNLRLAIRQLNGVEVPANSVFSFWKHVGRTSRLKGYVAGRELREGCLIPNLGGGLCQLSNALYDTAVRAGFEIVERHPHSQVIPGSLAETGRDATVFWNYVDLRFRSSHPFRIEAQLTADSLVVRFRGNSNDGRRQFLIPVRTQGIEKPSKIENCLSCETRGCFRHTSDITDNHFGRAAFLLDDYWPEFDRYISVTKHRRDLVCLPLDGKKFGKQNYGWTTSGFGTLKQNRFLTLWRSYKSRKLALHGATRQRFLLAANEKLAHRYASVLNYDVTHVTVMQQLLPFLWREGHLGGRTFDVLMTGLPLAVLQQRLDSAFRLHPQSVTLGDFRSDQELLDAESSALQQARKIITPHTQIAALYPEKTVLIDWAMPNAAAQLKTSGRGEAHIVFPGATLGRKGVYELRAVLERLNLQLMTMGPLLEGSDFWEGMKVSPLRADDDWLSNATAVVLPSFVEHRPRRLLEAVARGVPVIASTACGLENINGVTSIPPGDVESLYAEIERVVAASSSHALAS